MTLSVDARPVESPRAPDGFSVHTTNSDSLRANIRVSGHLSDGAAAVLAGVIESHLRANRRFLRVHVGGVRSLAPAAIDAIVRAHDRLLARRGTMILTGVTAALEAQLRGATPATPLFLVAPTADERLLLG